MKRTILTLLKVIGFVLGWALLSSLPLPDFKEPAIWRLAAELLPLLAILLLTVAFWFIERRNTALMPYAPNIKGTLLGAVLGAIWIAGSTGLLYYLKVLTLSEPVQIEDLAIWALALLCNVVMQEFLVRGYLYQLLRKEYGTFLAVLVTSGLFAAFHGASALLGGWLPLLNVLATGFFFCGAMELTGSIAAPILIHTVWNFVGGLVLGGVRLADDYPTMYEMTLKGEAYLTGGDFLLEGSAVTLLLTVVLGIIVWCFALGKRHHTSLRALPEEERNFEENQSFD